MQISNPLSSQLTRKSTQLTPKSPGPPGNRPDPPEKSPAHQKPNSVHQKSPGTPGNRPDPPEKPPEKDVILSSKNTDDVVNIKVQKEQDAEVRRQRILAELRAKSEDVEKGRELGADDYFIKANHTPAEIVEKVKYMLTNINHNK